jgi:heme-degrading monooxygenase HmoA
MAGVRLAVSIPAFCRCWSAARLGPIQHTRLCFIKQRKQFPSVRKRHLANLLCLQTLCYNPNDEERHMIARLWSARTTPENWPAYERHFIDNVVPELRSQKGYVASNLLKREVDGEIAITVLSFWRSLEAIDAFAGNDREAAVVAPNATPFLTNFDRRVQHFDLSFADTPFDLTY